MELQVVRKKGDWVAGVPGAFAIVGAIGFGVGIVDADMRAMLPELIVGSAVVAVVGGALFFLLRAGLVHTLRVREGCVQLVHRGVVTMEMASPVIAHGVFTELIEAGVARRNTPVAWVSIRDGECCVVVRKALGIHEGVPNWPRNAYAAPAEAVYSGDPVRLYRAVSRGAAT